MFYRLFLLITEYVGLMLFVIDPCRLNVLARLDSVIGPILIRKQRPIHQQRLMSSMPT